MTTLKLTRTTMLSAATAGGVFIGVAVALATWPLGIDRPERSPHVVVSPTTAPIDGIAGPDLRSVDVDLRRPIGAASTDSSAKTIAALASASSWKLVGTSVDAARPMALLMSPDGTTHWLAVGEHADDGTEVTGITAAGATIRTSGETIELKLPPAATDPFSAEIPAQ